MEVLCSICQQPLKAFKAGEAVFIGDIGPLCRECQEAAKQNNQIPPLAPVPPRPPLMVCKLKEDMSEADKEKLLSALRDWSGIMTVDNSLTVTKAIDREMVKRWMEALDLINHWCQTLKGLIDGPRNTMVEYNGDAALEIIAQIRCMVNDKIKLTPIINQMKEHLK